MKFKSLKWFFVGILLQAGVAIAAAPESVGAKIENFGLNPGYLGMYLYTPENMPDNAPLVLSLHGSNMTAAEQAEITHWAKLADAWKFYVVHVEALEGACNYSNPMLTTCFNSEDPNHYKRGMGEAESIKEMVDYVKDNFSVDDRKVYITGFSSGGMMSLAVAAAYPEVFASVGIISGGPFYGDKGEPSFFSRTSAEDWKARFKESCPDYKGEYPTFIYSAGSMDMMLPPSYARNLMTQLKAIHDIDGNADSSERLGSYIKVNSYNKNGKTAIKHYTIRNLGHAIPVDPGEGEAQGGSVPSSFMPMMKLAKDVNLYFPYHIAKFWGLDK